MGETTVITPTVDTAHPNDGNQAYEQQMLDKADAGTGAPQEPKLFAGKYKSEEDLTKGVLELIKMQHGGDLEAFYVTQQKNLGKKPEGGDVKPPAQSTTPPKTTIDPPPEKPEGTEEPKDETAEELPQVGALDFDKYNQEFLETGDISPETITEITKFGINESTVRNYVEGVKALQQANIAHAFGVVGGQANYEAMVQFARTSLSPEEIQTFNEQIAQRDLGKREEAIKGLFTRYTESNPQFIEGSTAGGTLPEGAFRSEAEFRQAMKDPRYTKDAAYRDTVLKRLEMSRL